MLYPLVVNWAVCVPNIIDIVYVYVIVTTAEEVTYIYNLLLFNDTVTEVLDEDATDTAEIVVGQLLSDTLKRFDKLY
jgi:hypothetical protein